MFFHLSTAVAISVAALFGGQVAATSIQCPVCPASIVYSGLTRTLSSTLYTSSAGIIQCNYDTPLISGFNPYCLYYNTGALYITNTGGSCPSTCSTEIQTTSTCEYPY